MGRESYPTVEALRSFLKAASFVVPEDLDLKSLLQEHLS